MTETGTVSDNAKFVNENNEVRPHQTHLGHIET
jgi:hypothetical protein